MRETGRTASRHACAGRAQTGSSRSTARLISKHTHPEAAEDQAKAPDPDNCRPEARPPRKDEVDTAELVPRARRPVGRVPKHDERLVERVERAGLLVLARRAERRGLAEGEDSVGRDEA